MAFFKFRKGADESGKAPAQAQTVESIRQRAKYRLAGATLLVLAGVIGLPMLFDKQPRPIAVDTPISIPDKNKVLPLVIPATPVSPATASPEPKAASTGDKSPVPAATPPAAPKEEFIDPKPAPADKPSVAKEARPKDTVATKPAASATQTKSIANPANNPPDASRAQALLDGKSATPKSTDAAAKAADATKAAKAAEAKAAAAKPASAADARFVVQVGAFADNDRAHEVRLKMEHAGLKTYAQTAETKDGKRIRVRVGPFSTRAEAEKAAEKIKKLNLPAALLTL